MAAIDDAINNLSEDEIDTLHSDPQLLNDFKAKYTGNMNQDTTLAGRDARVSAVNDAIKTSAEKLLSPLKDAAMFPFKAAEASQAVGKYAGRGAEAMAIGAGLPDPIAKAVGFTQSIKNDPMTYAGEIGNPESLLNGLKSTVGEAIESKLPAIMRFFGNVPERATEALTEAKGNLPPVSETELQQGFKNVGNALNRAKEYIGSKLNEAKSEVGLLTTPAEREESMMSYGNPHGIGPDNTNPLYEKLMATPKSREELVKNVGMFKQLAEQNSPIDRARLADILQNQINKVVDWKKSGDITEGLLKSQYGDLGNIIEGSSAKLADMKAKMSDVLGVFDELGKKFEEPGKAEDFLRSVFNGKKASTNDYIQKLAHLEVISGKPVLTDLFKKLASESYSKYVGRPALATAEGMYGAMHMNPIALVGLAAQSPKVLGKVAKAGYAASKAVNPTTAMAAIQAARSGTFPMSAFDEMNNRTMQSIRDRLKNGQ